MAESLLAPPILRWGRGRLTTPLPRLVEGWIRSLALRPSEDDIAGGERRGGGRPSEFVSRFSLFD